MPHPALPGHRLAWDRDSIGFYFRQGDVASTLMSQVQREDLNNEQDNVVFTQNGAGPTPVYIGVIFPAPTDVLGVYIAQGADRVTDIQTSLDTTDGFNGAWTTRESGTPVAGDDATIVASTRYRDNIATKSFLGVKAIRFKHEGGGGLVSWYALHLYGNRSATAEDLVVWDPVADARLGPLSFGDCPRRSSDDIEFRVKCFGILTSLNVILSVEDLVTAGGGAPDPADQLLVSTDGVNFAASALLGTLAPNQISRTCYLRRVTPINAALGVWQPRLLVSGTNKTDGVEYAEFADVSTNVPTPHIWYVYPDSVRIGDEVNIVGHGFGDSAAEYAGVAKEGATTVAPTSWGRTAATVDAYGSARAIEGLNDFVNVEYQRIKFTVPPGATDDLVTVVTNA